MCAQSAWKYRERWWYLAFGNVSVGNTATSNLTIANSGTVALVVTSIGYPTGFTGNFASGTIAPGASQVVVVAQGRAAAS